MTVEPMNVAGAAKRLGCSWQHVMNLFRSGKLVGFQNGKGKCIRFDPADVEAFILARKVEAQEAAADKASKANGKRASRKPVAKVRPIHPPDYSHRVAANWKK